MDPRLAAEVSMSVRISLSAIALSSYDLNTHVVEAGFILLDKL